MSKRRFGKKRASGKSRRPHVPLALALPMAADAVYIFNIAKNGLSQTEIVNLQWQYTGTTSDGKFSVTPLIGTYGKYVAGAAVHMLATKTGINKRLYKMTGGYFGI